MRANREKMEAMARARRTGARMSDANVVSSCYKIPM